ncbi:MAG: hypothetical protein Q9184_003294 [Pyrenodesmia sp. 2 TL-2023]
MYSHRVLLSNTAVLRVESSDLRDTNIVIHWHQAKPLGLPFVGNVSNSIRQARNPIRLNVLAGRRGSKRLANGGVTHPTHQAIGKARPATKSGGDIIATGHRPIAQGNKDPLDQVQRIETRQQLRPIAMITLIVIDTEDDPRALDLHHGPYEFTHQAYYDAVVRTIACKIADEYGSLVRTRVRRNSMPNASFASAGFAMSAHRRRCGTHLVVASLTPASIAEATQRSTAAARMKADVGYVWSMFEAKGTLLNLRGVEQKACVLRRPFFLWFYWYPARVAQLA